MEADKSIYFILKSACSFMELFYLLPNYVKTT